MNIPGKMKAALLLVVSLVVSLVMLWAVWEHPALSIAGQVSVVFLYAHPVARRLLKQVSGRDPLVDNAALTALVLGLYAAYGLETAGHVCIIGGAALSLVYTRTMRRRIPKDANGYHVTIR